MKTLFLDIGGVLLSNGWDHHLREKTAQLFRLDYQEINQRHALTFDTYEIGKITLDEYLDRVVFYQARDFSKESFKQFIFDQWVPFANMIELVKQLKKSESLKVVAVSNEGREFMEERIQRFQMKEFIDIFICSAFLKVRKPDLEIYHFALDISQAKSEEVIYIDDRSMFVQIAEKLGIRSIHHQNYEKTSQLLMDLLK